VNSPGPKIRADIVEVFVFRYGTDGLEFLQMLRRGGAVQESWQPVMGHCEPWETAVQCALRELEEETSLARESDKLLGFWALEQVHPFFMAEQNTIVMSPRFACKVDPDWEPRPNGEHSASRWVRHNRLEENFMWPGQLAALREIASHITEHSLARDRLKIEAAAVRR
jgi:dihydroneopterin triphosphate diphosphatase